MSIGVNEILLVLKIYSYICSYITIPYGIHNYLVCSIVECITVKLDRRLTKFVHSMLNSKNSTVRYLIAHFLTTESSVYNLQYLYLQRTVGILCINMIFLCLPGMEVGYEPADLTVHPLQNYRGWVHSFRIGV